MTVEQLLEGVVIPIDKPRGWTSFQAVNKIKSIIRNLYGLKKFKIGHAGTLDPLATGLLLVCVGKATKSIPQLQDGDKVYTGTMILGATTPCYDLEQAINQRFNYSHITRSLLDEKRHYFEGKIMQVPPMFSAVKIDGQRAYEYARIDDPSATIQPKPVHVYSFEITDFRPGSSEDTPSTIITKKSASTTKQSGTQPQLQLYKNPQGSVPKELPQVDFRIHCGKGTYIRSIARDFGLALDCGAFLSSLRRESVGEYTIDNALQLSDVEAYFSTL